MLKRKKNNKKIKIFGIIISTIGLVICLIVKGYNYYLDIKDNKKVENFLKIETSYENKNIYNDEEIDYSKVSSKENEYIGILEIPKINLKKGFYNLDNQNNDVSKNIQLIEKSDMPNVKNGTLILASHSGNDRVSYFKNLYKLTYNDEVFVYYDKDKYKYEVIDKYEVNKTGNITINKDKSITALVLITCSKEEETKQIVYICKLIEKEKIIG